MQFRFDAEVPKYLNSAAFSKAVIIICKHHAVSWGYTTPNVRQTTSGARVNILEPKILLLKLKPPFNISQKT